MSANIKTAIETFLEVHRIAEGRPELPDLSSNQLVAQVPVTFQLTDRKGSEGAAFAAVNEMYRAMGEALKDIIPVQWQPDAYGSIGTLRAYVFTPAEMRSVIESAYRMGADGRPYQPWALDKKLGLA